MYKMSFSLYLIEQTNHCNLKCVGCPNRLRLRPRGFMLPEMFRDVADQIVRFGNKHSRMALHGTGEPLLSPYLEENLNYLDGLGFTNVDFSTNGMILTTERAEELVRHPCLSWVRISLNSSRPELMERINTGADFERVVANTKNFLKVWRAAGKPFRAAVQLMHTKDNPDETVGDIHSLLGGDDFDVMVKKLNTFAGLTGDNELAVGGTGRARCVYGDRDYYVHWDGDIVGCCLDDTKWQVCGNVSDGLFSDKVFQRKRELAAAQQRGDFSELPLCKICMGR